MDIDTKNKSIYVIAYEYGVAIEECKEAYAKKKAYEDAFAEMFQKMQRESIRTGGRNGVYEQLKRKEAEDGGNL